MTPPIRSSPKAGCEQVDRGGPTGRVPCQLVEVERSRRTVAQQGDRTRGPDSDMYRFAFVVEQVLGHITHGANLRAHVPGDPAVEAHWVYPKYEVDGWAAHLPMLRSNWTLRSGVQARRGLRQVLRDTDLDAVFFHTQVPALVCHDVVRRLPSIISLDATPRQYDELGDVYGHETGTGLAERLKRRVATTSFAAADHLVTWSAWAKQDLVDGYGVKGDRITVVPPGVTFSEWARPTPRSPTRGPTRILFVGGDLARKGGLLLIEICRSLRNAHDVELHLVTRDHVPPESGIHVHHDVRPNSPELKDLYHRCDIFALPTFGDCLPMVLSEAGAAGLASVTTRVAAIPEVVLDATTGILVPPRDGTSLFRALERLVVDTDLRRRMGEQAVDHISRRFDTAKNTTRLLDLMKDASRATGPRATDGAR